jgi:flavin-dependent dehydrogenase
VSAPRHPGSPGRPAGTAEPESCDVLVIGGGPAGATIATLLAEHGWHVVIVEKASHPRFQIGESLLPQNLPLFERLGIREAVGAIGVVKLGADFTDETSGKGPKTFYFANAFDKTNDHAYEVRRDVFDRLLLDNAAGRGVDVHRRVEVAGLDLDPRHGSLVTVRDRMGGTRRWRARVVVDASGRQAFLARRLGLTRRDRRHASAAVFAHFAAVDRRTGRDAGNLSIYWFERGWLWMIPLPDGVMSVGAVCDPAYIKARASTPAALLAATIEGMPRAAARMRHAVPLTEARIAGNYSYCAQRAGGPGYLLVGDAFAFIDPVLSSGVLLAMTSAAHGAEVVDASLRDPAGAAKRLARYERDLRAALRRFSWFIHRFGSPMIRSLFTEATPPRRIEEAVSTVLAGDVFRRTPTTLGRIGFKAVYYARAAGMLREAVADRRRRRINVRTHLEESTAPHGPS